jgi:hypothetical protein
VTLRAGKFRHGRKVRVHLYVQRGPDPGDTDNSARHHAHGGPS